MTSSGKPVPPFFLTVSVLLTVRVVATVASQVLATVEAYAIGALGKSPAATLKESGVPQGTHLSAHPSISSISLFIWVSICLPTYQLARQHLPSMVCLRPTLCGVAEQTLHRVLPSKSHSPFLGCPHICSSLDISYISLKPRLSLGCHRDLSTQNTYSVFPALPTASLPGFPGSVNNPIGPT